MSAAMRLADILTVREQKEIAELRSAIRTADRDSKPGEPTEGPDTNTPAIASEDEAVRNVFNRILSDGGANAS